MHNTTSNQAVVLGASMAGLLAARVLSERFGQVVVIERDVLPSAGEHRRGVPHGRHLHGLHPRGREILDELFPGFTASLAASGAERGDVLGNVRWQLSGHQLRQATIGLPGLLASRPFLEGHLREMVRRLPAVRFVEDCSASGLIVTADNRTVTGVEVRGPGGGPPAQVAAAWWWTPPGEARAPRPGSNSSAISARPKTGSRSAWATRREPTGCGPAPWAATR